MSRTTIGIALVGTLVVGCSEDPQYVGPPAGASFSLEFDSAAMTTPPVPGVCPDLPNCVVMPFRLETMQEVMDRTELAVELMMSPDEIPFVTLDSAEISIEWSVKNLMDCDGLATFNINGGNQFFVYDPTVFVIDPDDDEEPPPLLGNMAPVSIPAGATVTGVFREDQIREAAIDLELITRAHYNPFRALLEVNKNLEMMEIYTETDLSMDPPPPQMGTGVFIPRQAWAQLTQFQMAFGGRGDTDSMNGCGSVHFVFEWDYRIRDRRGILHDHLLDAMAGELYPFAPVAYSPPGALP